jgi:hypothetical protein
LVRKFIITLLVRGSKKAKATNERKGIYTSHDDHLEAKKTIAAPARGRGAFVTESPTTLRDREPPTVSRAPNVTLLCDLSWDVVRAADLADVYASWKTMGLYSD